MKFNQADSPLISRCIAEQEKRTSAEIVVVIEPRAARYPEFRWMLATGIASIVLAIHLFSPWQVADVFLMIDVLAAFLLTFWVTQALNLPARLAGKHRRRHELKRAAVFHFLNHRVHTTRERTGILIFGALSERAFDVVVDEGVKAAIPVAEWARWMEGWKTVEKRGPAGARLLAQLESLGSLLERYLPSNGDNPDELPNAPMMPL